MLAEPGLLFGYQSDAYWLDIGTPEKYLQAHADVLAGRLSDSARARRARGRGRASGCRATRRSNPTRTSRRRCSSARARASKPAPGCTRRCSARRAVVEARAELDGAVLHAGARVSHGSSVHDSVVGAYAVLKPDVVARGRDDRRRAARRCRRARGSRAGGCPPSASSYRRAMQALVTGGAGFIGSTLVDRLLAEDWHVDVVDDLSTGSLANLGDGARAARPALLVPPPRRRVARGRRPDHAPPARRDLPPRRADRRARLGGAPGLRRDRQHPRLAQRVRRRGRGRREEGRVRGFGRHALRHPEKIPTKETSPQHPESPYGVAKKAVGDYLYYYRQQHGLEYTVLALANVYGPRQDPHGEAGVVAIFSNKLLDREAADDLRRRLADPRLRLRRRRRRRVRPRAPKRAAGSR